MTDRRMYTERGQFLAQQRSLSVIILQCERNF